MEHHTSPSNSLLIPKTITSMSPGSAAKIVGYSWIAMFILAIPTVLLVLEQLVVSGDTQASLLLIEGNETLLYLGIAAYFVILVLDTTIAMLLYSILQYQHKSLALAMSLLRILFVIVTATSLLALAVLNISVYSTGVLVGYAFLIPHLFLLGYLTTTSGYLSRYLGIFMIIGSLSYIVTMFGKFFITENLLQVIYPIAMIPASLAEISMGIYLIIKSSVLEDRIDFGSD